MIWVTALTGFLLIVAAVSYLWFTTPIPSPSALSQLQATTVLFSDGSYLGNIGAANRRSGPRSFTGVSGGLCPRSCLLGGADLARVHRRSPTLRRLLA